MQQSEIQDKIAILIEEIELANKEYYIEENSSISDFDYDKKFKKLLDLAAKFPNLITPDSPTQRVGNTPSSQFNQVSHQTPMLSLSNVFNFEELKDWIKRTTKITGENIFPLVCELKIDGLAVSIKYQNGSLVEASTRGNGSIGEDITNNIRTINSIPLRIASSENKKYDNFEARGEVYFPISKFNLFNQERLKQGLNIYSNPRNSSSGSVRQLDPKETAKRPINIFFYSLLGSDGKEITNSHLRSLKILRDIGLRTEKNFKKINSFTELKDFINYWNNSRQNLDYGTDGIVIKVDSIKLQKTLGNTGRTPRWATAFKFPPEVVETKLNKINFNVGRTGVLTPWAELEPVFIDGVKISRATLHNKDEIQRKDLRENDLVEIQRAGEVIPQILRVSKNNVRSMYSKEFSFPMKCPEPCNSTLFSDPNEVSVICISSSCPNKLERLLQYFTSKNCMDIEGLGNKICSILFKKNIIVSLDDIYKLNEKKDELLNIEGFGDLRINNLLLSIENSKNKPFSSLLTALGIDGVGVEIAELITKKIQTLKKLKEQIQTPEKLKEILIDIDGVGPIVAGNFLKWTNQKSNINLIDSFLELEISNEIEKIIHKTNNLENKIFVITGSFENLKRNDIGDLIKNNGGKVVNKVSKNTDYLILGENAGSKLLDAQNNNIKIINIEDLKILIPELGSQIS
ncbi:MAG: NAD-dependent DNA ligase LigA [Dehalococcoidales bacterium]|nr:NAD-dependent DNA ligase LigA [Dehalococcoidales bacterium]